MDPQPLSPARLRVVPESRDEALIAFQFRPAQASPLSVDCARLAGPDGESWLAGAIGESAETRGAAWAHGGPRRRRKRDESRSGWASCWPRKDSGSLLTGIRRLRARRMLGKWI